MRIGELTMLELDCVHEVPGSGAWLKVPLGKLLTERMVPIDEETVEIIDRIAEHRSPGLLLRHPRTGKLADFLLTHQGRRLSADSIRDELHRAAAEAGIDDVVPHMLRHISCLVTVLRLAPETLRAVISGCGGPCRVSIVRFVIMSFFSSRGWESWDIANRPLIPERMPVLIDDDLLFEDGSGDPRPSVAVNQWLRELPSSVAPSLAMWEAYARAVKEWMEFLGLHGVGVFDSRERLKAGLSRYAEHRAAWPGPAAVLRHDVGPA